MKYLLLAVNFLVSFNSIDAKLSAVEWPDSPKGMNGPAECKSEIMSLKCEHNALGYVIAKLERNGFKIVSLSNNEAIEPVWTVNYCR